MSVLIFDRPQEFNVITEKKTESIDYSEDISDDLLQFNPNHRVVSDSDDDEEEEEEDEEDEEDDD